MDFNARLEQYVKKVKKDYRSCMGNEAATKSALIEPLLTILGYDLADPSECKPEYKADFGEDRATKPVDWAFLIDDSPRFLVEAKAVGGKEISHYDEQLGDYYAKGQPAIVLGILTTGVQWRFFTDRVYQHIMDKTPFFEWNVLDDEIPFQLLSILQRAQFDSELIKAFATHRYQQSRLVAKLSAVLKPSTEFVKFALQDVEDHRNLTTAVIEQWIPIFVDAIQEWAQQQRLEKASQPAVDTPAEVQDDHATDAPFTAEGRVSVKDLIVAGILKPPIKLRKCYQDVHLEADLQPSGVIRFQGQEHTAPSSAAVAAAYHVSGKTRAIDGWQFWRFEDGAGNLVLLDDARREYLARHAT